MFLRRLLSVLVLLAVLVAPAAGGAEDSEHSHLRECLRHADKTPDAALAEADAWLLKGGGDAALACQATAQFHRNEFIKAAEVFLQLAGRARNDPQAAFLYQQAGLAYARDKDYKKSDDAFTKALKFEQQDPELWADRANARASSQHYWEAIDDLNMALKIMPDMLEALRVRGQVWYKLGVTAKAEADFRAAAQIQAEEDVLKHKKLSKTVSQK